MDEKSLTFWLKVTAGALLLSALIIIYLGNALFEQSTRLTHTAKDLTHVTDQRDALEALLAELSPSQPLEAVETAAAAAELALELRGEAPNQRVVIEGLSFPLRDGEVSFLEE